ncbi:MAG: hypothetical protein CMG75_00905 [Candidatus Marinimicrobia bacterium]|nr:hypothetical protein [Candidatus Neomarinimicrobiota bacterium]|tara:strand:- start:322 stop:1662 length:1341 start_codon:yes stop_codon:yes gene_type:complete
MRINLPSPSKFKDLLNEITFSKVENPITGVTLDSREAKPGDLFIALVGNKVDGHNYLFEASQKNCAAALVSKPNNSIKIQQISVDDPAITITEIGKKWRSLQSVEVIGITGSNGKTTTKELLLHIFSAWHLVHGTRGNYNTHLGLPLTLLELDSQHTQSFLEMGANHRGDIDHLCNLSLPRHGLITNIAPSHLSSFGSIETIAKTKGELFEFLPKNGIAFVNNDDNAIGKIETDAEKISFGFSSDCDFFGNIKLDNDGLITLSINGEDIPIRSANKIFAKNVFAASVIASTMGISWEGIKNQIKCFQGVKSRCELIKKNGITIIDDSYNANLTSSLAALDYLLNISSAGKKHFVFGDMLELGVSSKDHHRKIGVAASNNGVDYLYCYGYESSITAKAANGIESHHFKDKTSLLKLLRKNLNIGDTVLFKGSRGMSLESIIKELVKV